MSFLASITNNSSLQSNLKATVTNTKRLSLQKFMNSEPTADLDAKLTDRRTPLNNRCLNVSTVFKKCNINII